MVTPPAPRSDAPIVRPPPIRTDGTNAFARTSMVERVPRILAEVVVDDVALPETSRSRVRRLIADIASDQPMASSSLPAPDDEEWRAAVAAHGGATWLASPWFFAECNVYRQLLAACRYWETGRDPFAVAKARELAGEGPWQSLAALDELAEAAPPERIDALLALSLWGNRADLSHSVGTAFGRTGAEEDLLVDDRARVVTLAPGGDVHIVTDNGGSELVMDLALADAWISDFAAQVTLHVKMHPTFVSDATAADVWATLGAMRERGGSPARCAERLVSAFTREQLRIVPDFFWNGPRFLWEIPARLVRDIERATLVVVKGDANYRRAVGDAIWPDTTTFAQASAYFPAPLVCLRTLKSDALVGVPRPRMDALDVSDPQWRVNGRRGLIQFKGDAPR